MAYGFVYVLMNESMPGIYKIGFTTKHPKARMEELSRATSCPTPFELLAYFGTPQPYVAEQGIHEALEAQRVNPGREFFQATLFDIQCQLRCWADPHEDCFFTVLLEHLVDKEMMQFEIGRNS